MDVDELLRHHGVDTDRLEPAPPSPSWKEMRDHLALLAGCVICGVTCHSARVADTGSGPRLVGSAEATRRAYCPNRPRLPCSSERVPFMDDAGRYRLTLSTEDEPAA
ncbi:hypothetical protein BX257_0520 [Streptomyces sp. 3212.3]|jgi:hypothetical protein|nr:hypothetical protein ADL25_23775 [Streptomyces sp. NRRL F-5122]REE58110.1 hypothetical protein BX257_0520 [Streptomyces sp. 3212.3]